MSADVFSVNNRHSRVYTSHSSKLFARINSINLHNSPLGNSYLYRPLPNFGLKGKDSEKVGNLLKVTQQSGE